MTQPAAMAVSLLERMLLDSGSGVNAEIRDITTAAGTEIPSLAVENVTAANIPPDIVERSGKAAYPSMYLYCERASNELKEKFRAFSGTVDIAVEVRVTHDHPNEVARMTDVYVTAITSVLQKLRGRWAESLFYPGAYEILYGPVKRGGKNYIHATKVRLQVLASI